MTQPEIWRRVRDLEYWKKDVWILPIHRKHPVEHWVLCVILVNLNELLLFDSFASASGWERDVKVSIIPLRRWLGGCSDLDLQDIMAFITSLVLCSNREGHPLHIITEEGWTAQPLLAQAVQSNSYDCGLWVLAAIAAVLRGKHTTGLVESEIGVFRQALLRNIVYLTRCV